jgi:hypothetical protein
MPQRNRAHVCRRQYSRASSIKMFRLAWMRAHMVALDFRLRCIRERRLRMYGQKRQAFHRASVRTSLRSHSYVPDLRLTVPSETRRRKTASGRTLYRPQFQLVVETFSIPERGMISRVLQRWLAVVLGLYDVALLGRGAAGRSSPAIQ